MRNLHLRLEECQHLSREFQRRNPVDKVDSIGKDIDRKIMDSFIGKVERMCLERNALQFQHPIMAGANQRKVRNRSLNPPRERKEVEMHSPGRRRSIASNASRV